MSSINAISVDQLSRLVGTPKCPVLIDVRSDDDFAADPRLIPGSTRHPSVSAADWGQALQGRPAVAICRRGEVLSHGAAAWLRQCGSPADVLAGGAEAWAHADLP
ncbi:MAG TPA: rhodanese-like domain-containing protein, partial [Roseiarcus sp.]|nr:rhodanese-like domain-containing protein [Roseiarcus sp.]